MTTGGLNLAFSDDVKLGGGHHFPELYNLRDDDAEKSPLCHIIQEGITSCHLNCRLG